MTKKVLLAFYDDLSEPQQELAKKFVNELFFMDKTLKKLHQIISTEGAITEKTNGNGFKVREENPALKSYNAMIRNYNATLKHLLDLLPEKPSSDALRAFLEGKKKRA
ncbi:MAG: hypothetical protein IKK85_03490 [Clostridia bacterium]|nr:hypothetical protein [Clostridia bacterium]